MSGRIWTYGGEIPRRVNSPLLSTAQPPTLIILLPIRQRSIFNLFFCGICGIRTPPPHRQWDMPTITLHTPFYFNEQFAGMTGVEPITSWLTVKCSTNWATFPFTFQRTISTLQKYNYFFNLPNFFQKKTRFLLKPGWK